MATPEAVRDAVFNAASQNSELLNILSKTSEAPSLYAAHLIHFNRLETSLTEQTTLLDSLKTQTEMKFKSHRGLRDSITRKWFYKATKSLAKFEAKAMSEERAYFAALGTQSKAEERCKILENEVERAKVEKEELFNVRRVHDDTHKKIDELYERLFKGPTPGFGGEDKREIAFYKAEEGNEKVKEEIKGARKAKIGLGAVKTYLGRAKGNLDGALTAAEESFWIFDQATYYIERGYTAIGLAIDSLKNKEEHLFPLPQDILVIYQELGAYLQAAKITIGKLSSRDGVIGAIKSSQEILSKAGAKLEQLIEYTKEVEKAGLTKIKETARRVEDSRQELQQIRQGIFEKVAGFGQAAPSYMECCDRADTFCNVPEVAQEHVQPEAEAAPPTVEASEVAPPEYGQGASASSRFEVADVLRDHKEIQ
ncbi:hypothetical protein L207DRAFT_510375 [Hyaloscypha variabilis F]|uniref:Uncharacterized protein n=1 Tax=Hyaloscypha variabilis (strain UAMH 11265 / GT02V1 / F) TaxID=1149755 RepID=A0A2J6RU85_HYAVF|nr:hypothetical protein L207DRAFT_510375 [Hyaloscypha variabilis F]